jgi:hypothetical protein
MWGKFCPAAGPVKMVFPCRAEAQAKAQVVVPVVRVVPVAVRRTAVPGVVVPAATAVHTVRAIGRLVGYI